MIIITIILCMAFISITIVSNYINIIAMVVLRREADRPLCGQ